MIYLSAQPDTTYFTWQLALQLRNFHSMGILKENIQVLVAYNRELGLNPAFQIFIEENKHLASFYIYGDKRIKPKYTSSIRPNILKQHFDLFPGLVNETIMYHDSDILFSRIPEIVDVEKNDVCYVSDTRHYLDVNCIRYSASENLLNDMLNVVGLSKEKLMQEDNQTGGAQYILKKITSAFWEKVERDSEDLYTVMIDFNLKLWQKDYPSTKEFRSKKRGIQAWCADMWAVLWNLWLMDKNVEIHPEMEFSWPYNPIEDWNRLAIQHYSGIIEDKTKYFRKGEYINYMPWYDDALDIIPNSSCSYEIVKMIKNYRYNLDLNREACPNEEIILYSNAPDMHTIAIFNIYKKYLHKYLDIVITMCTEQLDQFVRIRTSGNFLKSCLIIPIDHLLNITEIKKILKGSSGLCISIKNLYQSDVLFTEAFSKILEIELLTNNKGKFMQATVSKPIYRICVAHHVTNSEPNFSSLKQGFLEEAYCLS
ncbi:MAG: hypothetical protein LBF27_24215 [Sphingobacterium sp.]|jgi:hypothetical protein|nr:hypothetical protein [Sphingobacterium sp.]